MSETETTGTTTAQHATMQIRELTDRVLKARLSPVWYRVAQTQPVDPGHCRHMQELVCELWRDLPPAREAALEERAAHAVRQYYYRTVRQWAALRAIVAWTLMIRDEQATIKTLRQHDHQRNQQEV